MKGCYFFMDHQTLLPCHIFKYEENIYILNINRMKYGKVTEELVKTLEELKKTQDFSAIKPGIMEELKRLKVIRHNYTLPSIEDMPAKVKNPVITTLNLFISQSCNLRCLYCYGGGGEYGKKGFMDETTAYRGIDWLIGQSGDEKKLSLSFFGGEPLMNFQLIKKIVSYCEEKEKEHDKKFDFAITTNGTLLSDEIISYCRGKKIAFLISFDGPKEVQDYNRPSKEGNFSSYDEAIRGIKKLLPEIPDTNVRATIYGDADIQYITDFLSDFGFASYHFVLASQSPHNRLSEEKNHILPVEKIIKFHRDYGEKILRAVKNREVDKIRKLKLSRFFRNFIPGDDPVRKYFYCGVGRFYAAMSASGDIYPCHRFVGLEEYKMGNIYSNDISRDEHLKSLVFTADKCIECWAKYFCGGNCVYEHMVSTGSIFDPAEEVCKIIKALTETAIYVSCELDKKDMAWLEDREIIPKIPCYFDF